MRPLSYRKQWNRIKDRDATPQTLSRLANRIALSFLDHYYYNAHFDDEYIQLLCEIATHFGDDPRSRIGSSVLFGTIVERLCDDLEELQTDAYNRLMSQVISFCRKAPGCEDLDQRLRAMGLFTQEDLLRHAGLLRSGFGCRREASETDVEKIFVLSRVTVGADVAITTAAIQRLMNLFPQAMIFLLGSPKLDQLFATCQAVRII